MGFRDLKCRNGAQNQNLREKLSKTGPVEKFWLWSKSMVKVNGQRSKSIVRVNGQLLTCADGACVTSPRADMVGRDAAAGACGAWVRVVWRVGARGRYWRRVERVFVRQKLQAARGGAREAVFGCSWLGFARDWMFCLSMPVIWQLNAQNVDIRVLQYCGRDGSGSLLTMMTGWRRGQRKNAGDVHRNQKVRGMTLIPC